MTTDLKSLPRGPLEHAFHNDLELVDGRNTSLRDALLMVFMMGASEATTLLSRTTCRAQSVKRQRWMAVEIEAVFERCAKAGKAKFRGRSANVVLHVLTPVSRRRQRKVPASA